MSRQIDYYESKLQFEIDSWDLNDALNKDQPIIIIDVRSPESFRAEQIPGAVNLPHRLINEENTAGWDKDALYVTYCDGIGCNASTKGALNLARLGFKVKELIGGLEWWRRDGYLTTGEDLKTGCGGDCACGCG